MKLLLATNHLGLGGSESYLLTVAEQLDRLGHDTVVYAPELGAGVEPARQRGIEVAGEDALDREYDAALVQDAGVSLEVAGRRPTLPQLFVAHSAKFDLQTPPQLGGPVARVVALNDRVASRMRSLAIAPEVVRLRQPIDIERFAPRSELPDSAETALLLSNTPSEDRYEMMRAACAEAGLRLDRLGGTHGQIADVRESIAGVDVVIGYGRSVLEAMSMGRAAFVYDWKGGDGWVTADTYEAIEADGIAGGAGLAALDMGALTAGLREYSPSMGPVNHDLVVTHHRANVHAERLLALLAEIAGSPVAPPRGPLEEMARLVRLEWRARLEINGLVHENGYLRGLLRESEERADELRQAVADEGRRAHELALAYEATASWRVTRPLRSLAAMRARAAAFLRRLRRAGPKGRPRAGGPDSDATRNAGG